MLSFSKYLEESNSAGSKFEIEVAQGVKKWLHASSLDSQFQAERFQTTNEDEQQGRSEDYSDVVVQNLTDGQQFFIECKQSVKTNIVTTQFDISEDFQLIPVKGKSRVPIDDQMTLQLAQDLMATDDYAKFIEFMQHPSSVVNGVKPADLYFGNIDATDSQLEKAISKYNKLVDSGKVEADCKKFDTGTIRETTRNMLLCGLCWRLHDESNTWDICHLEEIPYFGLLVKQHYLTGKIVPAFYLQMNNELFITDSRHNPFNIECTSFPDDVAGKFDLKFTPRFGSGSMYITPRSKILTDIESNSSFIDKDKWPQQH